MTNVYGTTTSYPYLDYSVYKDCSAILMKYGSKMVYLDHISS